MNTCTRLFDIRQSDSERTISQTPGAAHTGMLIHSLNKAKSGRMLLAYVRIIAYIGLDVYNCNH